MADDKKQRVVPLPEQREGRRLTPISSESAVRPEWWRRHPLKASFLACVLLPAFLATLYYGLIASDRYVAGAGFAVRGIEAGNGADLISSFTGLASTGSSTSDSYILLKFLESRDLVEKLEADLPFREIYGGRGADFLSQLDPDLEIEKVVDYWSRRIHPTFDNTSGIVTFEVEAFTPGDAKRIAAEVLASSKELVNKLSEQARKDAVADAEAEVERAELRLKKALEALQTFRDTEKALDPAGAARIRMELIGGLEKQLAEVNTRMAALQGEVTEGSPAMRVLKRQAQALKDQIARERAENSAFERGEPTALTSQLAAYEALEVEREFAQKAYASALTSLEQARLEADRQQRYLAVYSTPARPQYPLYPRRLLNIFLIFAGLTLLWGIGALVVASVRDHLT